jgi:hypothetical protein
MAVSDPRRAPKNNIERYVRAPMHQTIPARPAGTEKLRSCAPSTWSRLTPDNHNREDAEDRSCVGLSSARRMIWINDRTTIGEPFLFGNAPGGGKNGGQKHASRGGEARRPIGRMLG